MLKACVIARSHRSFSEGGDVAIQNCSKLVAFILLIFLCTACNSTKELKTNKIRLGYLLNITHAVPIVGIESGKFSNIEPYHFAAGGTLLSSLISKNLDLAYIGPGPVINALAKRIDIEILSASAYGANSFILARESQTQNKNFIIKKIAVPQFGNTQDLLAKMLVSEIKSGKFTNKDLNELNFAEEIEYIAVNPAELETAFFIGNIDAALVSEPWGTLLEAKGFTNANQLLAHINSYPTTLLVVRKEFYASHKAEIERFLEADAEIKSLLINQKATTIQLIKKQLEEKTKKKFEDQMLITSLNKVVFSKDLDKQKLNELSQIAFDAKYFRHRFNL